MKKLAAAVAVVLLSVVAVAGTTGSADAAKGWDAKKPGWDAQVNDAKGWD